MSTRFEKKIIMPKGDMGRTTLLDLSKEDRESVDRWHKKEWQEFVTEIEAYKHRVLGAARDTYLWHRERCVACKKARTLYTTYRKFKSKYHQRGSIMLGATGATGSAHTLFAASDCTINGSPNIFNLSDFCINPCAAYNRAKYDNDGDFYSSVGSTSYGTADGTWQGSCAVADYDGQWNKVSGDSPSASGTNADGVWGAMSSDVYLEYSHSFGILSGSFNIKLRDGTSLNVLLTDSFTMYVEAATKF